MLPFTVVLFLLMGGAAFAMPLLVGVVDPAVIEAAGIDAGDGFADPQRSFLTLYMWLNGDWDIQAVQGSPSALVLFYAFLFITILVMLNLLIAIMGDTFDRIQEQQKVQSRMVRAHLIHDIESAMPDTEKRWHKCLPTFLRPWCKDDPRLNPRAVLRVIKDGDVQAGDEWPYRLLSC